MAPRNFLHSKGIWTLDLDGACHQAQGPARLSQPQGVEI